LTRKRKAVVLGEFRHALTSFLEELSDAARSRKPKKKASREEGVRRAVNSGERRGERTRTDKGKTI